MSIERLYIAKDADMPEVYSFYQSLVSYSIKEFKEWLNLFKERESIYRAQYIVFEVSSKIQAILSLVDFMGDPQNTKVVNFQASPSYLNENIYNRLINHIGGYESFKHKKLGASYLESEIEVVLLFRKLGFDEVARYSRSFISSTSWTNIKLKLFDGYEILPFKDVEVNRENFFNEFYDLYESTLESIPENTSYKRCDINSFKTKISQLNINKEVSCFVVFDDSLIGMSIVLNEDKEVFIELTGVVPCHQRKGLATILKKYVLNKCKEVGVDKVCTYNEFKNDPILKINSLLGFKNEVSSIILEKKL